jgi:ribulose-phosphate 3-epimerase
VNYSCSISPGITGFEIACRKKVTDDNLDSMLKCSTSLWSADLANLASEIRRVEPYSDRFHLDVADGHYVKNMLFFPDQVKALRPHTRLHFEIHLMVTNPMDWIEPFAEAGADSFIFCFDSMKDPNGVLQTAAAIGKPSGISLMINEPLEMIEPFWDQISMVTIVGTALGIKGASMDASVAPKVRAARELICRRGLNVDIQVDGGIRRESVPVIYSAGADWIVPGSLMFKEDPPAMRQWLQSL